MVDVSPLSKSYIDKINTEQPMKFNLEQNKIFPVLVFILLIFLSIVGFLPSNINTNSYLVIGIFICYIFKIVVDTLKMTNLVHSKENGNYIKYFLTNILKYSYKNKITEYIEYIIILVILLYVLLTGFLGHMFHIIIPNKKSPCLSKLIKLKIFSFIYILLLLFDAFILYYNKSNLYILSLASYIVIGFAFLLHYKKSIINLNNKLNDNCIEEQQ